MYNLIIKIFFNRLDIFLVLNNIFLVLNNIRFLIF